MRRDLRRHHIHGPLGSINLSSIANTVKNVTKQASTFLEKNPEIKTQLQQLGAQELAKLQAKINSNNSGFFNASALNPVAASPQQVALMNNTVIRQLQIKRVGRTNYWRKLGYVGT